MDDETLNQESQNEGAPLPEDALTAAQAEEQESVNRQYDAIIAGQREGGPAVDPSAIKQLGDAAVYPEIEADGEPKSPTDQAIDHVISKGYSREAAEKIVAEHGAEAILAGKEGYQSEEDRQKEAVSREHYCAVCGIELSSNDPRSCAPGKCVMRPVPERSFDPERATREREHKIEK
jgi:hypothetical protein